ncbi:MAG: helix-turn-helix transcriptional regulator [Saprospiraceae bacterium]|nr:helix-turn-helix transcriptional regulator [Saprospiraceae bacterium]
MEFSLFRFSPNIKPDIFVKDPESSQLGSDIVKYSVEMIDDIGFEEFTFKKLAHHIGTTEATVYRYFENKHKLLLYLTSWYWSWIEYQLVMRNTNIPDPYIRLKNSIKILTAPKDLQYDHIDLQKLFNVICGESSKSYLNKNVDDLNKFGVFFNYKKIVSLISEIVLEINPGYRYPHMLVTTIIEGIHHQLYFAEHLPSLTDRDNNSDYLLDFFMELSNVASNQNR